MDQAACLVGMVQKAEESIIACGNTDTTAGSFKSVLHCLLVASGLVACENRPYPRGTKEQLFPCSALQGITQQVVPGQRINMAGVKGITTTGLTESKTILLFVHGSQGDWKAWSYYLETPALAGFSNRITIDRPSFGGSGKGAVVTDLRQQAALIPNGQKAIVVGHSLGGPSAVWMAINSPDRVCGVISTAGSLSSRYEEPRWYNLLADSALLGWAVLLKWRGQTERR